MYMQIVLFFSAIYTIVQNFPIFITLVDATCMLEVHFKGKGDSPRSPRATLVENKHIPAYSYALPGVK